MATIIDDQEPADPRPERIDDRARRETRLAPPAMQANRLPSPLVECGCGDCYDAFVDPLAEGGPQVYAADECSEPQPLTVERGAESYLRYQRSAWTDTSQTSTYERARGTYARLLDTDRGLRERYGDALTTVLVTRRLSPLDDDGGWLEPLAIDAQLHNESARRSFTRALRYHLRDFEFEYVGVTATTDSAATPHEHVYLWIEDPDDQVTVDHLAPAIEKHVAKVANAYDDDHPVQADGNHGAVTIRHEPPLVDHVPDRLSEIRTQSDVVDGSIVPVNTRGAQYLASQLPHLVLGDVYDGTTEVQQTRIDGGAIAWASPYDWLRSSSGIDLQPSQ